MKLMRQKNSSKILTSLVLTFMLCTFLSLTVFAGGGAKVKKLTVDTKKVDVTTESTVLVNAQVTATKEAAPKILKVSAKSSNKKVATVKVLSKPSSSGVTGGTQIMISGKKPGTSIVTITTAAKNKKGKRLSKKIKVSVRKATVILSEGSPIDGTKVKYTSGGKYAYYYYTFKTKSFKGAAPFRVQVGEYYDNETYTVSPNTTYELVLGVAFRGYTLTIYYGGSYGYSRFMPSPNAYQNFELAVTLPDGSRKSFVKSEKGDVTTTAIVSFKEV